MPFYDMKNKFFRWALRLFMMIGSCSERYRNPVTKTALLNKLRYQLMAVTSYFLRLKTPKL